MAATLTEAHRILAAPAGVIPGCTWVASKAEWLEAAQRAVNGDTADLDFYLEQEAAELWRMPEWRQDAWFAARAAESTVPPMGRVA